MDPSSTENPIEEAVWTYRGYRLGHGEFSSAMSHFFRAYIGRADIWRTRLDSTTNWAVVTTGAAISIAFSKHDPGAHLVIPLSSVLVTLFLIIEARRYRYYELWSSRARLMETDFFASMLVPPFRPAPDWADSLAENLLHPEFPITFWEAFGRRYRYNYLWIYVVLGVAWVMSVWIHPVPVTELGAFFERASVGPFPGGLIFGIGVAFQGALLLCGWLTMGMVETTGDVLPRYSRPDIKLDDSLKSQPWYRPASRVPKQMLALLITTEPRKVGRRIIAETCRGVTEIQARGAFTNRDQTILLIALTITEIAGLKAIVASEDPAAFLIISPAEEILGSGFISLDPEHAEGIT